MKHTNHIKSCKISNEQLGIEVGDLYYDSLSDFLKALSSKLELDSKADNDRGRTKLSNNLKNASELILEASEEIDSAWSVCKKPVEDWLEENNKKRI